MSYCNRCGAYIPMEETACPACGYDPDAERRAAEAEREEAERRHAEEERRRAAEEERARAAEQRRAEEQRRMEEQRRAEEARNRYRTSTRTGSYTASSTSRTYTYSTSQRKGAAQSGTQQEIWKAPWENGEQKSYDPSQDYNRARAKDSVDNQRLSILSYLGPLFVIPLFRRENDPFARFHANQGLVLFLFEAAVNLLADWLGGLGWAISLAGGVFAISCIVRGIRNVKAGKMEKLPWIGDISILK